MNKTTVALILSCQVKMIALIQQFCILKYNNYCLNALAIYMHCDLVCQIYWILNEQILVG